MWFQVMAQRYGEARDWSEQVERAAQRGGFKQTARRALGLLPGRVGMHTTSTGFRVLVRGLLPGRVGMHTTSTGFRVLLRGRMQYI